MHYISSILEVDTETSFVNVGLIFQQIATKKRIVFTSGFAQYKITEQTKIVFFEQGYQGLGEYWHKRRKRK